MRSFLNMIAAHTSETNARKDIILVGTRKDEVEGANESERKAALRQLSDQIFEGLRDCTAFSRVRYNEKDGMWMHAIENSRSDDPAIRDLAKAIDSATDDLPSMSVQIPQGWLLVFDELQAAVLPAASAAAAAVAATTAAAAATITPTTIAIATASAAAAATTPQPLLLLIATSYSSWCPAPIGRI